MPWENADPMSVAFGTAAAYLGGQQTAKDRARKEQQEDEQDRQTAISNQTAVGYKDAMERIAQQNADTRTTATEDTSQYRKEQLAQQEKDKLREDATKRFSIQQTAIYHSTMSEEKKWQTLAMIQARHQDIEAQIASGQLKTDKEVASKYAAIDASIQNNIRSTSTSAANNERSTSTSAANSIRSSDTARADNANTVGAANTRAANSAAMAQYKIQNAANTAAVAAGNDPPFPDLKPPAAAAATGVAPAPNPAVAPFVKIAATVPKAQRVKLVTTSKPYMSADPATQKAILAAVQALP